MTDASRTPITGGVMTAASAVPAIQREPGLPGQTVVVIGGSAGIGSCSSRRELMLSFVNTFRRCHSMVRAR
jgi:hypothetical protein